MESQAAPKKKRKKRRRQLSRLHLDILQPALDACKSEQAWKDAADRLCTQLPTELGNSAETRDRVLAFLVSHCGKSASAKLVSFWNTTAGKQWHSRKGRWSAKTKTEAQAVATKVGALSVEQVQAWMSRKRKKDQSSKKTAGQAAKKPKGRGRADQSQERKKTAPKKKAAKKKAAKKKAAKTAKPKAAAHMFVSLLDQPDPREKCGGCGSHGCTKTHTGVEVHCPECGVRKLNNSDGTATHVHVGSRSGKKRPLPAGENRS